MLRTLTYLIPEAYSKPCQVYKMMRNIENTGTEEFVQAFGMNHFTKRSIVIY